MLRDLLVATIVLPSAVAEKGAFNSVCFATASPGGTRYIAVAANFEDFALWTVPAMVCRSQGRSIRLQIDHPHSH